MRRSLLLACSVLGALATSASVADQSDELSRLREEAAKQRQEIEATEARIRALEQGSGSSAPATPASPLAQLQRSWAQVEPGAPQDRVRELLGTPEKVLRIDGALVWYYVYPGIGPGSVFFNESGKVSGRQSPSFGWW